jgi:Tfp pilus assembly pilus retraction ATPase PilT
METDVAPINRVIAPTTEHPAQKYLTWLVAHYKQDKASDIILRPSCEGRCFFWANGRFQIAKGWACVTDENGRLLETLFPFEKAAKALNPDHQKGTSVVFRLRDYQVRVQVNMDNETASDEEGGRRLTNRTIIVRVQERVPPTLSTIFDRTPNTLPLLRNARGLVIVCGPLGSGKTTLASSIVNDMAETGKHIMTIEDPVEYWLEPSKGLVSHYNARFLDQRDDGRPSLQALIPQALRSKISGLFIGEIREHNSLATALEFSGAHASVITTFHAGSISDCIVRMVTMASNAMKENVAKTTLAQCVHSILYANLAFTEKGDAIPIVMCLPVQHATVRKLIAECNPTSMQMDLEAALNNPEVAGRGAITREMCIAEALAKGATKESIAAALPPPIQF